MIFGVLQQVLNELFVDVQEEKVSFYHGDLFEPSHFRLNDVFLKTTLINTLQLPFELAAGYIGHVNVEGLVGAVAGFPLDIKVNDICLVLRPKQVEWGNELLMRYARELVVVIWQSLMAPSVDKKGGALFISPAKWLSGRIQAARADTIVQLERIHIRVESERSGKLVAYGLHIPLIRFAPREIEEQILYRRQQPGVTYPKASDNSTSKLLTLEKVSLYTDLNAKAFWTPPSEAEVPPIPAANITPTDQSAATSADNSQPQFTQEMALALFRECVLKPFPRDRRRELVFVRVIWAKLDFERRTQNLGWSRTKQVLTSSVLAALDVVTEEIELSIDFAQIAALLYELEHVANHLKLARMQKWRPTCIDRERQCPPSVKVSPNALLPLPPATSEDLASITFSSDKQCKSKTWFRAMWRYAFRCVLEYNRSNRRVWSGRHVESGSDPKYWWHRHEYKNDEDDNELQEIRRQRYIHLYARYLDPAAMEIVLYGRAKGLLGLNLQQTNIDAASEASGRGKPPPASPRRHVLPEFEPLTLGERWEFSDFIATMAVYEQRVCRALAERELRRDFSTAPPSPTRKVSSAMEFPEESVEPTPQPSHHGRSYSVDCLSFPPASDSLNDSPDSLPSQRRYHTLGAAVGVSQLNGTSSLHQQSIRLASPPTSRPHAASTSQVGSPIKTKNTPSMEARREWVSKQPDYSESWLEMQFFPAWLLDSSRCIPLLNWQLGPMTARLSEGNSDQTGRIAYIEIGIGSCSGAILLGRTPFLRLLAEMRVGLFHASLLTQPYPYPHDGEDETANPVTEYKWISGDYIREPEDGFFYVGLKYSSHEFAAKPTGRVQFMGDEEWSLKGRMCIGPTKIDCNEAAMRAAMGAAKAAEMRAEIDFSAPTHFSILSDTYHSFIRLVAQFPKKKKKKLAAQHSADANALNITTIAKASVSDPPTQGDTTDGQDQLQNQVKMARLLHALLLRSSTFELEVGSLELNLSAYTSHMDRVTHSSKEATGAPESREDVNVTIPMTTYRLQNRPTMNECLVDVAGARIVYRSTMQGRAAVVRHLSQYLKL